MTLFFTILCSFRLERKKRETLEKVEEAKKAGLELKVLEEAMKTLELEEEQLKKKEEELRLKDKVSSAPTFCFIVALMNVLSIIDLFLLDNAMECRHNQQTWFHKDCCQRSTTPK